MLEGMQRHGWEPILDRGNPIGLKHGGASISLEPAGQFELSGARCADAARDRRSCRRISREVRRGHRPRWAWASRRSASTRPHSRDEMPWMPKGRYAIMRRYMPKVGSLGLDMMTRTCTVQVNLDYGAEADMVRKLRVSLALQPLATALFANSPFTEGQPNGFLIIRAQVWTDTDDARSGIPAVMFETGSVSSATPNGWSTVPMYFVYPRGPVDRRGRADVPRLPGRPAADLAGETRHHGRLRRPYDDRLHRCAAEAVPGNARRGCRQRRT